MNGPVRCPKIFMNFGPQKG